MRNTLLTLLACTVLSTTTFAETFTKGPTRAEEIHAGQHNQMLNDYYNQFSHETLLRKFEAIAPARPFAEYEKNGYVIFSDGDNFDSMKAKQEIAKNLPVDVTLVVFTNYSKDYVGNLFAGFIAPERLKVIEVGFGNGFWARDALPVPAILNDSRLRLVDAKYYHGFENDAVFAKAFGAELVAHGYYYEGGNFMPNKLGDCLTVDKEAMGTVINDDILKAYYGCKKIYRLPFVKGIGHIDESAKFISDKVIVTDSPEYKEILEKAGFQVHMLPRPDQPMETYVNSLLVNGTLFMPAFNETNDQAAIQVYQSLGLKVVALNSSILSNQGMGSIHCITMNYPPVPFHVLKSALSNKLH